MKYDACCADQSFRPLQHSVILHRNLTKSSEAYLDSNTYQVFSQSMEK